MTQYLLSVYEREGDPTPDPASQQTVYQQVDAVNQELQAAGAWVFAGGLHPVDTATLVTAKDGNVVVTDGPFAESKEHLGGFWVIETPDLDTALDWAGRASAACMQPVEMRPFQDVPES